MTLLITMPNNFTLVGIGSGDWNALEAKGQEEFDFSDLQGKNLCKEVSPCPDEFRNIVSSNPPCRYRHKETGEWHNDANSPMKDREQWERIDLTPVEISQLEQRYGAATWYEWQRQNWGTKWGTYGLKVHELGGDGMPVMIECQTAWGPPTPDMMRRITDYLRDQWCIKGIRWMGHDPYDDSVVDIEVADVSPV